MAHNIPLKEVKITSIIRCTETAAILFAMGKWRIMGFAEVEGGELEHRGWTLTGIEFDTQEDALEYFANEFIVNVH